MNVLDQDYNFLGITESEYSQYATSKCVIQQIPYEYTSSYKTGSNKGPEAILQTSHYVEFFDSELGSEAYKTVGISTLAELDLQQKVDKDAMDAIAAATDAHLKNNKFLVTLGAEHTITYGVFKAFQEKWNDIGILQLDAHSDLRMSYEGNKWSHASVMARIVELGAPIYQVGIRAQCKEESELYQNNDKIHCWYAHQIWHDDAWMDEVVSALPKTLYITIDTDGFDPSICPSVGTPEPGGLMWYPTLKFLKKVFTHCDVKGFDIVELNPKTEEDVTAYTMAQLCYKLIGYKFCL